MKLKQIKKPTPKCPECNTHMVSRYHCNRQKGGWHTDAVYKWVCPNCGAEFVEAVSEDKPKVICKNCFDEIRQGGHPEKKAVLGEDKK